MITTDAFTFTTLEREIVLHRLCNPEALLEILDGARLNDNATKRLELEDSAYELIRWMSNADPREQTHLNAYHKFILARCCSKSDFFIHMNERIEDGELVSLAMWRRAAERLEGKLSVKIPRY